MSEGSYALFPEAGGRRRRGDREWLMYDPVVMRHPIDGWQRYQNATQMWLHTLWGYLTGGIMTKARTLRVCIVKFEDVLFQPDNVVEGLTKIGLPRNARPFEELHKGVGGHMRVGRNLEEVKEREYEALDSFREHELESLGEALEECPGLFLHLGYPLPSDRLALDEADALAEIAAVREREAAEREAA